MTDAELIATIEDSFSLFYDYEIPDMLFRLNIPGVRGKYTNIPHPFANGVGMSTLEPENADATIAAIKEFFESKQLPFSWIAGPLSKPSDLSERLTAAGLVPAMNMAGLVYRDITQPFPHNPEVVVRETTEADYEDYARVAAEGFGFPLPLAELFTRLYNMQGDIRVRNYLAYAPGNDVPGAFAATVYIPDSPVVLLGGAATIPDQRAAGLYSALVARRLADAALDGRTTAIIQAVRTTSAPVLMKRGFEEVCSITMWVGGMPKAPENTEPSETAV